jgi:hypothetical protein
VGATAWIGKLLSQSQIGRRLLSALPSRAIESGDIEGAVEATMDIAESWLNTAELTSADPRVQQAAEGAAEEFQAAAEALDKAGLLDASALELSTAHMQAGSAQLETATAAVTSTTVPDC